MDVHARLEDAADAIIAALGNVTDWGLAGTRAGQYHSDIAADAAAVEVLTGAGLGVLSEESGRHHPDREITVVVDPLDGSTNASHGVPWYAISLCAVDGEGALAALVVDLPHRRRFRAERGAGASVDGERLQPTTRTTVAQAVVAMNGYPPTRIGWYSRILGAAALDLCAVAEGTLDGYVDFSDDSLGPWDYLGGMLVCREAGAIVADAFGRDLVVLEHAARRTPIAAGTVRLYDACASARRAG